MEFPGIFFLLRKAFHIALKGTKHLEWFVVVINSACIPVRTIIGADVCLIFMEDEGFFTFAGCMMVFLGDIESYDDHKGTGGLCGRLGEELASAYAGARLPNGQDGALGFEEGNL